MGEQTPPVFFFSWDDPPGISRYSRTMLQKSQVMGCNMEWAQWPGMICRLDMSMYLYIYIDLSIYLSIYYIIFIHLFNCLFIMFYLYTYLYICHISYVYIYIHTNTQLVLQCYNGKLMEYIMINNVIFACICKWGEPVSPQMAMITVDLGYK